MQVFRRLLATIAATALLLQVGAVPAYATSTVTVNANYTQPGSFIGSSNAAYNSCGRYWPSRGKFQTLSNGVVRGIGVRFRLSKDELDALKCVQRNFTSPLLELDFTVYDVNAPLQWGNYADYIMATS